MLIRSNYRGSIYTLTDRQIYDLINKMHYRGCTATARMLKREINRRYGSQSITQEQRA